MLGSFVNRVGLIKLYIQKGEIEKSKEQAEEVLRNDPESIAGYLLMTWHYYMLSQGEDALHWMDETLRIAPEDEGALELAVMTYQDFHSDEHKVRELIEEGLRLYPDNHLFHAKFAQINRMTDMEQTLSSYREAIRLSPRNDAYLGDYAMLLYQDHKKLEEAEKYERLALEANPEHSMNLLNFAWVAYQRRKYKKAQTLIDEAMRLEPEDERIREYYKKIHPTKNGFIRIKIEINLLLLKAVGYPTRFISELFKDRISYKLILFTVFAIELGGLFALFGKKNTFIIFGVYILFLITSSKLSKSMLKKAGFIDDEEKLMKRKVDENQKSALKELEKVLEKDSVQPRREQAHAPLTSNELEAQLSQLWNSTNISEIKESTKVNDASVYQEELQTSPTSQPARLPTEWPKEQSRWPVVIMIAAIMLGMIGRFGPIMLERADRPVPLAPELKETIQTTQENLAQEKESAITDENKQVVEQFMQDLREGTIEQAVSTIVSEDYASFILENDQFTKQLGNAILEKVIQPHMGLSISYFLLVNAEEDFHAIVEVSFGRITHMYAEDLNQTEEEETKYQKLMERIELDGEDIK
ncbi:tetratricopeptide repeat protein [Sporosarcina jiandibaonis]|uniref:tetratricopeptide repeat protein n=1 Tax=Sporosarcina jiandibaonis TaxID=2715535 RepID=UPI0015546097|nr:hypothetical protein [Sporosarcina jiandibaonis]